MENFGEKLKRLRKEQNLTQSELASELYVTRQAVSLWENNSSYPSIEVLIKISEKFDISLDTLLKEDEVLKSKIIKDSKKVKYPFLHTFIFCLSISIIIGAIVGYMYEDYYLGIVIFAIIAVLLDFERRYSNK
ncbi:helix-turn-helix domain-containing protein [Macrococcus equi]|uniref:helix-turn-helix domain-containing protein n=1 Tax=Macrococcus equi TaxID=3395462 RepID=UPI0039BEBFFA